MWRKLFLRTSLKLFFNGQTASLGQFIALRYPNGLPQAPVSFHFTALTVKVSSTTTRLDYLRNFFKG